MTGEPLLDRAIPVLHITSSAAAEAFYRGKLGFEIEFAGRVHPTVLDPVYMSVVREGARIHLSSHAGDAVAGGVAYIPTRDVDALYDELRQRATPIHLGPIDQSWGVREMYVLDPDGNCIRFGTLIREPG